MRRKVILERLGWVGKVSRARAGRRGGVNWVRFGYFLVAGGLAIARGFYTAGSLEF